MKTSADHDLELLNATTIPTGPGSRLSTSPPNCPSVDRHTRIVFVAESHDQAQGHAAVAAAPGQAQQANAMLSAIVTGQLTLPP